MLEAHLVVVDAATAARDRTAPIGTTSPTVRPRRPWTAVEDAHVRTSFGTATIADIARGLGRSKAAVTQRAQKTLHLFMRRRGTPSVPWAPSEDDFLCISYGHVPTKEIAATLHRTTASVHCRASKLKVTRQTIRGPNRPWTKEDEGFVVRNVGRLGADEIAEELNRTPVAVKARASSPHWNPAVHRRTRKVWSPAEDAVLESRYGRTPAAYLAQSLGRTRHSIYKRALTLGVTRKNAATPPRTWTTAEDDLLRVMYGTIRSKEAAMELGRSTGSVHHRAEHLGLTSPVRSPEFLRRQSLPRTARPFPGLSDPLSIGYVAGIIDGEGSILGLPKAAIQVSMTTPEVIGRLWELCGGNMTGPYVQRSGRAEVCKPQYHWTISSSENAYRLLKILLPHLIVKREKAEEVIRSLEKKWSL